MPDVLREEGGEHVHADDDDGEQAHLGHEPHLRRQVAEAECQHAVEQRVDHHHGHREQLSPDRV